MPRRFWMIALTLGAAIASTAVAQDETTNILLIGKDRDHPPKTHEYMAECALLAKCLEQTPGVKATVSDGWPTDADAFKDVDAIAFYTANAGDIFLNPAHREQAEQLLSDGVGLVALHWSTAANMENGPRWMEIMGGWFNPSFSEIPVVESSIRPVAPDHPIARGWDETPMTDEYYIKLKYLDAAKPVVMTEVNGTDYPVGWVYERPDGGRSFGYVCGHFHDCFRIPAFRRSVVNGILWTAGVEVPEGGAPVDVTDQDLVLPPDPRVSEQ
ncbi:ThuA domain-containing protein [Tautonia rosea]|uniref:ThuA domain-containing protein n=1 Tax=Tautonia rosea TaxID=2728037 RepID=UPI001474B1B3|nr:ThuA domain-containing protein [Tautonia rosea]